MPRERIEIQVPDEVLAQNSGKKALFDEASRMEQTRRVPVLFNANQWFVQAQRTGSCSGYLAGSRENLRCQLLNIKWRAEHLSTIDDQIIPTESLILCPDVGSPRGTEFDMQWDWPDDQPVKCHHLLSEPQQIDSLQLPDPAGGLNQTIIQWHEQFKQIVDDFELFVNGEPVAIKIKLGYGGGPIPSAFALAGQNLFLWMAMDPDRVHRLMQIVTQSHIQCQDMVDEINGDPKGGSMGMGCDSAEMISPWMFREFVVPYYLNIWEQHPGSRSFHMCGKIDHLLEILIDELEISMLNGFGFPLDPKRLADVMGGKAILMGGPSPMLLNDGSIELIRQTTQQYIRTLAPYGGYLFYLGGSMVPNTPIEHIHAMVDAAKELESNMP